METGLVHGEIFPKEDMQIANRHTRRCSASLTFREMQVRTTMRYHFTFLRMAIIKQTTDNRHWRGREEKGTLVLLVGMLTNTPTMENNMEGPQKTKKQRCCMIQQSYSWACVC